MSDTEAQAMTAKAIPVTQEGLAQLEQELDRLRHTRRQEVADRIRQAKEFASSQNNPEFDDAKNEQALVEGRILTLEAMIQNAYVIDEQSARSSDSVRLGSVVGVLGPGQRSQEFRIVGAAEANPAKGQISNESPVGRALLGRRAGDEIQVMAPSGVIRMTVVSVR
jgi:transcription elongation factor GreA